MMDIRPLRTEADYDWALAEIEAYFDEEPEAGSPDADRFDVLARLIESYENEHWPIGKADPIELIRYTMDLKGWGQNDLARIVGSRSRASELLNRKRPLTLAMIQRLNSEWGIPAEALIAPYSVNDAA